ncbi:hypothetical protein [Geitlerinema sp. PCC 9228]|jgi:hypothetical protein|uniref:hypothetical protein n=1 Tax=Geitlerinema sp. PCC 9228 TaxID=111611 RepID=UPI0008F9D6CC|nr:hypothetical protein [Geitlerinema sp. PCC 9228]
MEPSHPNSNELHIGPLAPYEDRLLHALAFFRTNRNPAIQAKHCLSMYLRQSENRIMREIEFYARACGMEPFQLLESIYQNPEKADRMIRESLNRDISAIFNESNFSSSEEDG